MLFMGDKRFYDDQTSRLFCVAAVMVTLLYQEQCLVGLHHKQQRTKPKYVWLHHLICQAMAVATAKLKSLDCKADF